MPRSKRASASLRRDTQPATPATLARALVVRGLRKDGRGAGGPLEQLHESIGAHLTVGLLVGVPQELGRDRATGPHLFREGAERPGRSGGAEQGVQSLALAGFDAARKFYLFFVGEHPAPRRTHSDRGGRGRPIVGHWCSGGQGLEGEPVLGAILSLASEGCGVCVHGSSRSLE